jgi:1,4-alpha-glucan branching enzyme
LTASPLGYFSFVLHSHLPYVRLAGVWPHGEEMIQEAMAETYLPLLSALYDLKEEGLSPRLTIGLTPILLEQIADAGVISRFEAYLVERAEIAADDCVRLDRAGDQHRAYLARFYAGWYENVLHDFSDRFGRDVVGAFRRLQDDGNLDILTGAATHSYLPLLRRDSLVSAQLKIGRDTSRRHLGRAPSGVWLPECAYRPAFFDGPAHYRRPGLEEHLEGLDLGYFFTDTHVIRGGQVIGKSAGDAIGPYGQIPSRELAPLSPSDPYATSRTTQRPYLVQSSRVAVLGREARTGMQVWSAGQGYPGDFWYREFHKKDDVSGLQYWRVTDPSGDLGSKATYDPHQAELRVAEHARHFVSILEELVQESTPDGRPPLVVSAYDTELFGHWWFEGISWIKSVLRTLATHPAVAQTTVADYVRQSPPTAAMAVPESSWGSGGTHWTWDNEQTAWIWPLIHDAETRMETIVARHPNATGRRLDALNQAGRELLLLSSSDWPFLVTTRQARDYATMRFQQHLARFNRLCAIAGSEGITAESGRFLDTVAQLDNPFPDIDYRTFGRADQP